MGYQPRRQAQVKARITPGIGNEAGPIGAPSFSTFRLGKHFHKAAGTCKGEEHVRSFPTGATASSQSVNRDCFKPKVCPPSAGYWRQSSRHTCRLLLTIPGRKRGQLPRGYFQFRGSLGRLQKLVTRTILEQS